MQTPSSALSITDNGDGTSTLVVPTEAVPALQACLFLELRNERIQARFAELKKRMKAEDAIGLLADEFHLSRSRIRQIVYPLSKEVSP